MFATIATPVSDRTRYLAAGLVAMVVGAFAAVQLRHGVTPMLDTASYWSGVEATRHGHPFTTTLAPSFSNFDALQMLRRGGRLPFVDFPVGYPLLAGLLGVVTGARGAMIAVTVGATGLMGFIAVAGPRSRSVTHAMLAVRAVVAFGIAALPAYRLTTQGALSEPLFCAAAICLVGALVEYRDAARSWVVPAVLIAACGLFRFVGAALVALLLVEMWRRREALRHLAIAATVATGPTVINIVWANAAGGGHRAGWRGLDRHDIDTLARSIGGWWNSTLGDLRLTYFSADRSLAWWVWTVVALWFAAVAIAAVITVWSAATGQSSPTADVGATRIAAMAARVPDELALGLCAAGLLVGALVAGMAGFDALVIADNRLMLPIGMLTLVAMAWSVRPTARRRLMATGVLALAWVAVATGPTDWTESFSAPGVRAVVDPAVLPNGHQVAIVLTNDADTIHWASGLPTAYMPFATNSLTGAAVDTAQIYESLPCELARHDGLIIISDASLFGPGDVDALDRLVAAGRLVRLPSALGEAFAATADCAAPSS